MKRAFASTSVRLWATLCLSVCGAGCSDKDSDGDAPEETDTRAVLDGEIDVLTWWVSPGEVEALQALVDVFNSQYTGLDLINIVSIEGGVDAFEVEVSRRFNEGNPPVLIQALPMQYPNLTNNEKISSLDKLYKSQDWRNAFPQEILDEVKEDDTTYGVPVGIHRTNTLFFNPLIVENPPETLEDLIALAESLRTRGIRPIAVDNENGHEYILEAAFAASTGVDFYSRFMAGQIDVDDEDNVSKISAALDDTKRLMDATDWEETIDLEWTEAAESLFNGDTAMYVNGDWVRSYLVSLGATPGIDFQAMATPGTRKMFQFSLDTFVLSKETAFKENGIEFLKVMGSREGEAAFCKLKGATPLLDGVATDGWDDVAIETYEDYRNAKYLVSAGTPEYAIDGFSNVIMGYIDGSTTKEQTIANIQNTYKIAP